MILKRKWLLLLLFIPSVCFPQSTTKPQFLAYENHPWVDSLFNSMSPRERLAQLFMVAAYSNRDSVYEKELVEYVSHNGMGGVIFFQGGPVRQACLTNRLQDSSKYPLLVAMDAEWGLAMRLDSTMRFPYAMALGAVQEPHLLYETGAAMARQCRRMGVHINFAPVLDVNNNPANPVIGFRSFGENADEVTWRAYEFAKGMQDGGVLAVGKHFPGHGDTDVDSHLDLPQILHSPERLDSVELSPFRYAVEQGFGGMMIAHLNVPALDSSGLPTTLSEKVVKGLLRDKMGFEGLVFTDALNMDGVARHYQPGEVDYLAFKAGNDVMLFSQDVPKALDLIMEAVKRGEVSQQEIDARCRKVLALKYWAGLHRYAPIKQDRLLRDLNHPDDELLSTHLAESFLTVLENKDEILPINDLKDRKIAVVSLSHEKDTAFSQMLLQYADVATYDALSHFTDAQFDSVLNKALKADIVIVGIMNMSVFPRNKFGMSEAAINFISKLSASGKAIVVVLGNPYALDAWPDVEKARGLVVGYQKTPTIQSMAAQLIFGAIGANGKLPVSIGKKYRQGQGGVVKSLGRLKYTIPEDAGLSRFALQKIDSLAALAISSNATPGCQVMVVKEGMVVWQKSYGYHTYDSLVPVRNDDLYDMASITKVAATTTALMKLYDEGKFRLDDPLSDYLPYFKRGNKKDLTFRELLAHQAGLKSWTPFWKETLRKNGTFKWWTFKEDSSKRYPVKVAERLYLHRKYRKKLYKAIRSSEVGEKKYVYSDLSFYLYPDIVEKLSGQPFEEFLDEHFFRPLGANGFSFNPYREYQREKIVPTEYDSLFRKQLLWSVVHDEGSAMMGGVSGHAGLFATANDLARLAQVWCNYGEYGGRRYLREETVREFTRCQYCHESGNRRALGFDRPLETPHENGNTAKSVSQSSFGHSGFTGTMVWVDPELNIVYVFLSNRVYPSRENKKLFNLNTRTNIQQVIYESEAGARE